MTKNEYTGLYPEFCMVSQWSVTFNGVENIGMTNLGT
jgi:hypothetical protein